MIFPYKLIYLISAHYGYLKWHIISVWTIANFPWFIHGELRGKRVLFGSDWAEQTKYNTSQNGRMGFSHMRLKMQSLLFYPGR
ncbi:hypothetical protein HanPI659440_Chr04g0155631 [Helianthus annuus]|nr:hypothetical protein HanPI659440_Chr04g0155631 [Helianthus annuus]